MIGQVRDDGRPGGSREQSEEEPVRRGAEDEDAPRPRSSHDDRSAAAHKRHLEYHDNRDQASKPSRRSRLENGMSIWNFVILAYNSRVPTCRPYTQSPTHAKSPTSLTTRLKAKKVSVDAWVTVPPLTFPHA